ncbi:hypothetical protein SNE40_001591 [Patella caerulea]|uniref:Uncharacterized protein n=1 Tax=Patella caerulea TaxID=87958 RepID=A0AAN8KE93_PATCE
MLHPKYFNLCNLNTPITTFLFGDDVGKEIRKCETSLRLRHDKPLFYATTPRRAVRSNRFYQYPGRGSASSQLAYNRSRPYSAYNRPHPYNYRGRTRPGRGAFQFQGSNTKTSST